MAMAYDPKKYSFKWRATAYKCKPGTAAKVFGKIEKEKGELKAEHVVEAARDEGSPLHKDFTWENKTAATRWRTHEARMMISSLVRVKIEKGEPVGKDHRAFVSVTQDDLPRKYLNIDDAMENPEISPRVLTGALSRAQHWLDEYWAFREVEELKQPYKYVQEAVTHLQDVVAKKHQAVVNSAG